MSTDSSLLRVRVPSSVAKYDLHHEGGNGIVFESGSVLTAPPTAYVTVPALVPNCQCLRHRNPRHGAEGPIAPV